MEMYMSLYMQSSIQCLQSRRGIILRRWSVRRISSRQKQCDTREFDLIALAPGGKLSDYYCVREIDQDGKVVIDNSAVRETDYAMFDGLYDSGANELEKNVDGRVSCTSGNGDAAQKKDYTVEYDLLDTTGVTTITNREEITEGTVIVKSANVAFEGQILL